MQDVYTAVKTTITATVTDVQLIVSLLREIRPSSATSTEERASKRPKTTEYAVLAPSCPIRDQLTGGTARRRRSASSL